MQIQDYIGLISLVLAISALFLQMRSNGRQLRLQNFTEYTKRYQEIMLKLPGNITSEMFDIESLSTERREILLRYLRAYFDLCSEEYYLFQKKFIDKKVWFLWEDGMMSTFDKRAFKEAWNIISADTCYSESFSRFAEGIMES